MAHLSRKCCRILIVPLIVGTFCCCETTHRQEISISINPWVGFTPVAYAQQKGWLDECPIRLLWVVGLEENVKLYRQGLSDGFVATQYEYLRLPDPQKLQPYMLFDRSCGADVILSNRTTDELKSSPQIKAILEVTSLNQDLLEAFIKKYQLDSKQFILEPSDPEHLSTIKVSTEPAVLIAYEPYATQVEKNGFQRVASTRTLTETLVIDALWLSAQLSDNDLETVQHFKKAIDRAIAALHTNPREYYQTVQGYLENQSFDEFKASLDGIEWLNTPEQSALAKDSLQKQGITTGRVL